MTSGKSSASFAAPSGTCTYSPARQRGSWSAKVLEPTATAMGRDVVWSHPAFAGKCMFARNDKELICVSLAK